MLRRVKKDAEQAAAVIESQVILPSTIGEASGRVLSLVWAAADAIVAVASPRRQVVQALKLTAAGDRVPAAMTSFGPGPHLTIRRRK